MYKCKDCPFKLGCDLATQEEIELLRQVCNTLLDIGFGMDTAIAIAYKVLYVVNQLGDNDDVTEVIIMLQEPYANEADGLVVVMNEVDRGPYDAQVNGESPSDIFHEAAPTGERHDTAGERLEVWNFSADGEPVDVENVPPATDLELRGSMLAYDTDPTDTAESYESYGSFLIASGERDASELQ